MASIIYKGRRGGSVIVDRATPYTAVFNVVGTTLNNYTSSFGVPTSVTPVARGF